MGKRTPRLAAPSWWPARPMRCRPLATDGRRLDLHHQVDGAHVDAQLERRGGHQAADASRPSAPPRSPRAASRASEPWCARTSVSPGQLVEGRGQPLGQAAAVDEEQGRAVRADQLQQARVDGGPDRGRGGPRGRGRSGHLRRLGQRGPCPRPAPRCAVERLACPASTMVTGRQAERVQPLANSSAPRPRPPRPPRAAAACMSGAGRTGLGAARGSAPPRRAAAASRRGRCAGAGRPASASSRSSDSARCAPRLVGTSAWISSTITVSTAAQARSRALRGQQQVERLGRGDEDVGRLAAEAGPLRAGVSPVRTAIAGKRWASPRRPRRWRCRPAARAGCARRPPPAP